MLRYALAYIGTAIAFVLLDAIWLSAMGPALYRQTLGDILLREFNAGPAIAFYILFAAGIVIFAIVPAFDTHWSVALLHGALFGFFAYATYDLSNHATLRNWTLTLTIVDIAWGTLLTGVSSLAGLSLSQVVS